MKKIVLKLYEFDELSKDSQERIIEREHWNVMEHGMVPVFENSHCKLMRL